MQSLKRDLAIGSCISALTLAFALAWGGPFVGTGTAYAEDEAPQAQEPQPQTQEPQQQADQGQKATTFTGKIVKAGHDFALRAQSGTVYKLDDAQRASQYEGKTVKVTGELDEQAMTIHVENIEAAEA